MSQQYTYIHKICATCEFWGGTRTFFDRNQQRIIVESATVKARCFNRDSGWFTDKSGRQACFHCNHYQRWALLRG